MRMVFIYGPPAVGKLTVAREISARTGFKLFDNHTTIDWALRFFDFGQEAFWRLVRAFRDAVFEECAREDLDLVVTFVYAQQADLELVERRLAIVEQHGGRVCLVQLTCEREVLEARVQSVERAVRGKLSTVEGLLDLMQRHDLFSPIPGRESLTIDNTHL
jgi:shikimate kinase